ncbi:MAG: hypothetical protein V1827_01695 [Candidatus Micrarchaeota archaeon]
MKRILLACLVLVFILSGCNMKKPVSVGCCILDSSQDPPVCGELKGSDSNTMVTATNFCNVTDGVCNITVEVSLEGVSNSSDLVVPICSNSTSGCLGSDCVAQVCGGLHYNPAPLPTYKDSLNFGAEAESTGKIGAVEESKENAPIGLYGASCSMQPSGDELTSYLKNMRGSFVNTFRFGVGDSFEEFGHYRWMFPISDLYCNVNPAAGSKDRFMNYLLSPEEFEDKVDGVPYDKPDEKAASEEFCLEEDESPFLGQEFQGAVSPDYRYVRTKRGSFAAGFINETSLDKEFYADFLSLIYEKEMWSGLFQGSTTPVPAPFECTSPMDCASGYCNMQEYNRMLCYNELFGNWVLCGCDSASKTCLGQRSEIVYLDNKKPKTAADLEKYFEGYKDGERFLKIDPLPVGVVRVGVDPDCSSDGTEIKGIDRIWVNADPPITVLDFIEDGVIVPTPEQQEQIDNCTDLGDFTECDYMLGQLMSALPRDVLSPGETLEDGTFPNDIIFFGTPKEGHIGYTLLSLPRFQQTDFYIACQPEYDVVLAVQQFGGVSLHPVDPAYDGDDLDKREDTTSAVKNAKLFIPPEPIPDYLGYSWDPPDNRIRCVWDGDDNNGHYRWVPKYIMIKNAGNCQAEENSGIPITKAFGWCEPCSYSTLAKQQVNTTAGYSPSPFKIQYKSYFFDSPENIWLWKPTTTEEDAPDADMYFLQGTTDDPNNEYRAYVKLMFNGTPDSVYLQERQSQLLKENVMPILDIASSSNWDPNGHLKLNNTIIDRGPSILIVQNINATGLVDSRILERINSSRKACPTCLIALRLSTGSPHMLNASERYDMTMQAYHHISPDVAPGLFGYVDMLTFEFYPDEYTKEKPNSCTLPPEDRNPRIIDILENTSRTLMMATGKPVMVTDFSIIGDGSCWGPGNTQIFMSNLFLKQKKLVKAGLTGILYTNVSTLTIPKGDHLENFCAVEKGSHSMVAEEPATIYSKVYESAPDSVLCIGCSETDIIMGGCNQTCSSGAGCIADEDVLSSAKEQLGLPAETPDAEVPLRCPSQTIPYPCPPCSERTESLDCTFYRSDGTTLEAQYDISSLTVLEADIISSIPSPYACCISDESGNYTFMKATSMGKITAPVLFSTGGDPREDCGIADLSLLAEPTCSIPLPIKNHKVECKII